MVQLTNRTKGVNVPENGVRLLNKVAETRQTLTGNFGVA
jgi:hypothetical protein